MELTKEQIIIKTLFKDFTTAYNSRNISKIVCMSHAGAFKIFKKIEKKEIVKPKRIGNAVIYSLNFENPLTKKIIETILLIESQNYKRWVEEFNELEEKTQFVVLFGSILKNEKNARDIDLLIVADKDKFNEIKRIIEEKTKISNKKIHIILQTMEDFSNDISNRNKVSIEIIKNGIVLFGQDKIRQILFNNLK